MKKITLIALLSIIFLPTLSKHIIFDLGGVLLNRSKSKVVRHIGITQFCSYLFWYGNYPQEIFEISMNVLDHLEPPVEGDHEPLVYFYAKKVRKLPAITCKWLAGLISSDEVLARTEKLIAELDAKNYFSSTTEKELVKKSITCMFDTDRIAHSTKKLSRGVSLARKLSEKGHTLYILSNWDTESFKRIYENQDFFDLFKYFPKERILISGEINDYKPHPSAFDHLLKRFSLDASECIFFDDQVENIKSAQSLGIAAFQVPKKKFKQLIKKLKRIGIL